MTTTPSPVNPWCFLGFVYEQTPLETWVIEKLKELDEAHELPNPEELFSPEERERTRVRQRRRRLATAIAEVARSDEDPVADLDKTKETVCRNKNRLRAKLKQIGLTIRGGRVRRPRLHISDC